MELKSIITIFITISIVSMLFTGIAYIEKGKKERKLFQNTNNLIYTAIGLFVVITVLLLVLEVKLNIQMGSSLMYIIIGVVKLLIASYIGDIAKKQNRNSILWFILGFIEFHAALIALALGKSVYKVPSSSKTLFNELTVSTKEKVSSLKALSSSVRKSNNSIALQNEYVIPLNKIKREYSTEFDELLKREQQEEYRNISLQKYLRAYKAGIMSEEEYNSKVSKLNNQ